MIERPAAASAFASRITSMATKEGISAGVGRLRSVGWCPANCWARRAFDMDIGITYSGDGLGAKRYKQSILRAAPPGTTYLAGCARRWSTRQACHSIADFDFC